MDNSQIVAFVASFGILELPIFQHYVIIIDFSNFEVKGGLDPASEKQSL